VDADAVELRVLGCLIEKQRTTPDQYPLSLNSLRLACNQSTNRDPVVAYDEPLIRAAIEKLSRRGWIRLASGPGSRVAKYRHLFDETMSLDGAETSLLAMLMLRGTQTAAELKTRTDRMYHFGSVAEAEERLRRLAERDLVRLLDRRPGERESRWTHLLGGDEVPTAPAAPASPASPASPAPESDLEVRVARLEELVAELRERLA
jgi:uncharacterized protein YceH (UPF0502 family)